jgi:dihydrofolate reductase
VSAVRNVVLYLLLSLDGVAEEPGDWMGDAGPEVFDNLARVIGTQDTVLLGCGTYDYWVDYWPTSDVEPFATFVNSTPKFVYSSSPPTATWSNSTVVSTPATEHVAQLRAATGGDIGIHGSIDLARSLWRAGLVDRLELVVAPAVAGSGRRFFADPAELTRLELSDDSRSSGGAVFLTHDAPSPS